MTGKELQVHVSNGVNSNTNQKEFVAAMLRDHRTLQQSFTRLCVLWLETIAENDACDGRNEASVKLAKEFVKNCPNRGLPLI